MKKYIFLLASLAILSCKQSPKTTSDENIIIKSVETGLDKKLDSIHKRGFYHGIGVAIVNEKGPIYTNGYGYRDRKIRADYTEHTIQNIASISKVVVGLTLLKAVEDGHLSLDDDINKYLDFEVRNPKFPDSVIRVRNLTSHTSSIKDGDYYDLSYVNLESDAADNPKINQEELAFFQNADDAMTLEEFLKNGFAITDSNNKNYIFNNYAPGTGYDYSNIGAGLMALVIENAVGKDFKTYSKEVILDPLGLKNTSWRLSDLDTRMVSTNYSSLELRYPNYELVTDADGGLNSTPYDLGLILSEIIKGYQGTGTLLSTASYVQFFKKQLKADKFTDPEILEEIDKGFNHGVFIEYNNQYIGHTGGDPGTNTVMFFEPETGLGFVLFLNTDINSKESYYTFMEIRTTLNDYSKKLLKK